MSSEKKRIQEQMLINSAIAAIKRQLSDLEKSRNKFIAAAVAARESGITSQYRLAKNAIRIVSAQKNVVEQMLLNLQISSQIKDVSEMTKTFADGMKMLSGSITDTAGGLDFEKVGKQMSKAMLSTQMKQAEVDTFLGETQSGFDAFADSVGASGGISSDEIDRMIEAQLGAESVDSDIAELERRLNINNGRT